MEKLIKSCEKSLANKFEYLEDIALFNQEKVLNAFKSNNLALRHFAGTTGYGYGDDGRDTLNRVFAQIFGAEQGIKLNIGTNCKIGDNVHITASDDVTIGNDCLFASNIYIFPYFA